MFGLRKQNIPERSAAASAPNNTDKSLKQGGIFSLEQIQEIVAQQSALSGTRSPAEYCPSIFLRGLKWETDLPPTKHLKINAGCI